MNRFSDFLVTVPLMIVSCNYPIRLSDYTGSYINGSQLAKMKKSISDMSLP